MNKIKFELQPQKQSKAGLRPWAVEDKPVGSKRGDEGPSYRYPESVLERFHLWPGTKMLDVSQRPSIDP